MGLADRSRLYISNELTNRLVHRWRSEEAAILIGTNTALYDNPVLSNRHWPGPSPLRLVLDRGLRLPPDLKLLSDGASTVILNEKKQGREGVLQFEKLEPDENLARAITATLYRLKILSVLIEGGPRLIQSFVDEGIWDEARIISNASILQSPGVPAPRLQDGMLVSSEQYLDDRVDYYRHLPS